MRPPPARILDFGCGTGQIAAAIAQRGYGVTACDFAEDMINIARSQHPLSTVKWIRLPPDWKVLPFESGSFDAVIASSVFEYLSDLPGVAAELSRVVRPEGVLLVTVPNPFNRVRKIEGLLQALLSRRRLFCLQRARRVESYAAYLRLSRNRLIGHGWRSVLATAQFAPLDEREFLERIWRERAGLPLVLMAMKRLAPSGPTPG